MKFIAKNIVLALVAVTVWAASAAQAEQVTYVVDQGHSNIGFKVRHLVSYTRGHFNDFEGTISFDTDDFTKATVSGTIKTASIDTNNEKRDNHLRNADFFDAPNHPTITFKSTKVKKAGGDLYKVWGDLTIRGVTKNVELDAEYTGMATDPWGNEKLGLTVTGEIDRQEFNIKWSKTLDAGGLVVGDTVKLSLEIEANKKK